MTWRRPAAMIKVLIEPLIRFPFAIGFPRLQVVQQCLPEAGRCNPRRPARPGREIPPI
jgi:hypothetical protein